MSTTGFLGLDLGGTGAKAAVYDESGRLLGSGQAGYTPVTDSEGRTEIAIEEILDAARLSVLQASRESGASIRAMSISSQGETFVSLDADDRPLHKAIMWYDSRATEEAGLLREAVCASGGEAVWVHAIATAPKVMWLRRRFPEAMSRAVKYLLLPEFVSYKLTGEAVTDPCTAASTGLYADDTPDYSPEALAASGISHGSVARIQAAGTRIGTILPGVAEEWGLSADTVLVTGTNDQYAGAVGAGNCRPGIVTETTGTCLALVTLTRNLPSPLPDGIFGGRFPITEYQFALAYAKTAGVTLDWYKRQFCTEKGFRELDEDAAGVPIGSNGITFLPHFDGTYWPYANPDARGFICGLALNHTSTDIYRAVLESLSFSLREHVELLQANGFPIEVIRSIGGGAKSDLWLQMKADVMGVPVERPQVTESATLGAAMIAAVGVGEHSSLAESSQSLYHVDRLFEPNEDAHAAYQGPYTRYRDYCRRLYGECGMEDL